MSLNSFLFQEKKEIILIKTEKYILNKIVHMNIIQGEFFYLKASKYLKKQASYKKNVYNKNFVFPSRKSNSKKMFPIPHTLGIKLWDFKWEPLFFIAVNFYGVDFPPRKKSLYCRYFFGTMRISWDISIT